jgi:hypothetical protein
MSTGIEHKGNGEVSTAPKHNTMTVYTRNGGKIPRILITTFDGMAAFRPGRFMPRERVPCTHWIGTKVSLNVMTVKFKQWRKQSTV